MDSSPQNPYASPQTAAEFLPAEQQRPSLWHLWVWLILAVSVSLWGSPADPISIWLALAFGLLAFGVGAVQAASLPRVVRLVFLIAWLIAVGGLSIWGGVSATMVGAWIYGLGSIGLGWTASARLSEGRTRIVFAFCAGYVFGSILGPLGTIAGAITGALLARGTLPRHRPT